MFSSKSRSLIEKATSELLLETDWSYNLYICDLIRGLELSPKAALTCLKKRLTHDNPIVILHALNLLETMMKNCGPPMHEEVAQRENIKVLTKLTSSTSSVLTKVLELLQNWAFVFKDQAAYQEIQDAYEELKSSGFQFPPFSENDAMFSTACPPNWKDGETCHRCKVSFNTFRRKHHCRNCGNVFCSECTSMKSMIPRFGIEKEVRVCDPCHEKISLMQGQEKLNSDHCSNKISGESLKSKNNDHERECKRERELEMQQEEEFQLALALSASEAESRYKQRPGSFHQGFSTSSTPTQIANSLIAHHPSVVRSNELINGYRHVQPMLDTSEMDPELAHYLNRHYWESRAIDQTAPSNPIPTSCSVSERQIEPDTVPVTQPSAPMFSPSPAGPSQIINGLAEPNDVQTNDSLTPKPVINIRSTSPYGVPPLTTKQQEQFLSALQGSIEFFTNRMLSDSQRGRSIANDTTVQALFTTLHEMHPQLLQYMHQLEGRRAFYEGLQDKLSQLREAREALDSLRADATERRHQEEAEAARLRQMQLMQKLEVMRQQKRDYLEYKCRMVYEQTMQYQRQYQVQPGGTYQPVSFIPNCNDTQTSQHTLGHPIPPIPSCTNLPGSSLTGLNVYNQITGHETKLIGTGLPPVNYSEYPYPYPAAGYPVSAYKTVPQTQDVFNLQPILQSLPPTDGQFNQPGITSTFGCANISDGSAFHPGHTAHTSEGVIASSVPQQVPNTYHPIQSTQNNIPLSQNIDSEPSYHSSLGIVTTPLTSNISLTAGVAPLNQSVNAHQLNAVSAMILPSPPNDPINSDISAQVVSLPKVPSGELEESARTKPLRSPLEAQLISFD